jgi:hypothetical protein
MDKSPKDLILGRLDKVVSRESLGAIGTILALVESNAPPKYVALVGCVLIAGLSLEKAAKAAFQGWAQYKSLGAPKVEEASVKDSQESESDSPSFE